MQAPPPGDLSPHGLGLSLKESLALNFPAQVHLKSSSNMEPPCRQSQPQLWQPPLAHCQGEPLDPGSFQTRMAAQVALLSAQPMRSALN